MKKQRTISELLQVMLDNFDEYFYFGLCVLAANIKEAHIITWKEYCKIDFYLEEESKNHVSIDGFWWEHSLREPRIAWLKEHIELTKPVRKLSNLFWVMLCNFKYFERGLCVLNTRLWIVDILSKKEYYLIGDYLSVWEKSHHSDKLYWWTEGKKLPRILWLIKHIIINKIKGN